MSSFDNITASGNRHRKMAKKGRYGDTEMAHVTVGEQVLPLNVQTPRLMTVAAEEFARRGVPMDRYRVKSTKNSKHPDTGNPEFFSLGKVFKGVVGAATGYATGGPAGAVAGGLNGLMSDDGGSGQAGSGTASGQSYDPTPLPQTVKSVASAIPQAPTIQDTGDIVQGSSGVDDALAALAGGYPQPDQSRSYIDSLIATPDNTPQLRSVNPFTGAQEFYTTPSINQSTGKQMFASSYTTPKYANEQFLRSLGYTGAFGAGGGNQWLAANPGKKAKYDAWTSSQGVNAFKLLQPNNNYVSPAPAPSAPAPANTPAPTLTKDQQVYTDTARRLGIFDGTQVAKDGALDAALTKVSPEMLNRFNQEITKQGYQAYTPLAMRPQQPTQPSTTAPIETAVAKPTARTIVNITNAAPGTTYGMKGYTGGTVIYSDGTTEPYKDFFAREVGNQYLGGANFMDYIGKSYKSPTATQPPTPTPAVTAPKPPTPLVTPVSPTKPVPPVPPKPDVSTLYPQQPTTTQPTSEKPQMLTGGEYFDTGNAINEGSSGGSSSGTSGSGGTASSGSTGTGGSSPIDNTTSATSSLSPTRNDRFQSRSRSGMMARNF